MFKKNVCTVLGKVATVFFNADGERSTISIGLSLDESYKGTDGTWVNKSSLRFFSAFGNYATLLSGQTEKGDMVSIDFSPTSKKDDATGKHTPYDNIVTVVNFTHMINRQGSKGNTTSSADKNPAPKPTQVDDEPLF